MLVLSRKKGEQVVCIHEGITLTLEIIDIRGDKVRLGLIAPKEMEIYRGEIYQKRSEEEVKK